MRNIIVFSILFLYCINATAKKYETDNSIINLKYGFKLGDLITIEDIIISEKKYEKNPKLFIEGDDDLKLIKQSKSILQSSNKYIFKNKVTYQIYLKTKSGQYELPKHSYKVNNINISMPKKSYWFTRVAESKLNNILTNSVDQKKPELMIIVSSYLNIALGIIFLCLLILLYKNLDLPFLKKMNGPFAKAHKKIKKLHKNQHKDNYVKAILILTDAFNKSFNKNINSSNFNELINDNNKFKEVKGAIKIFINLSSIEIYSSKTYFSKKRFDEIYSFAKILRTIERKV